MEWYSGYVFVFFASFFFYYLIDFILDMAGAEKPSSNDTGRGCLAFFLAALVWILILVL